MPITEARHQFEVTDEYGLHLRLASRFVHLASLFESEIRISFRDQIANGKSILDLLTLAAGHGSQLCLEARGADADVAVAALAELLRGWFCEERETGPCSPDPHGPPAPRAALMRGGQ